MAVKYDEYFTKASKTYGVDKSLLIAVAQTESGIDANAVSSAGAVGVMQLMPSTAKSLGVTNSYDAEQNIMGGAKYLSQLLAEFDGNESLALASYNAGMSRVKTLGDVPSYAQNYVDKVLTTKEESESGKQKITIEDWVNNENTHALNGDASNLAKNNMDWWGDVLKVVIVLLLIVGCVIFVYMAISHAGNNILSKEVSKMAGDLVENIGKEGGNTDGN